MPGRTIPEEFRACSGLKEISRFWAKLPPWRMEREIESEVALGVKELRTSCYNKEPALITVCPYYGHLV